MEKTIFSAIFLIVAGIFMREYGGSSLLLWGIGGLAGWIGVIMGLVVVIIWIVPHLRGPIRRFMESDDGEQEK